LAANGQSERAYNAVHENERVVTLEIDGDVTPEMAAHVAGRIWNPMPSQRYLRHDEIGTRPRHSDSLALARLLIAYRIVAAHNEVGVSAGPAAAIAGTS
jgi:hypothetical protein